MMRRNLTTSMANSRNNSCANWTNKWKDIEASSACRAKEESRKDNSGLKKSRSTQGKVINMGICNGKGFFLIVELMGFLVVESMS
jgi:hypothetical protein